MKYVECRVYIVYIHYFCIKKQPMRYIISILLAALSVSLQYMVGDFPVVLFAFPLNVVLLSAWILAIAWTWRNARKSSFVRFMLSPAATCWAVFLVLALCLAIGLSGRRDLAVSWMSVFIFLFFQTVLLYVILRGYRRPTATGERLGAVRWRFLFLHAGLLFAVVSAFWGAPDKAELRFKSFRNVPVREAYGPDGKREWLSYDVELKVFDMTSGADGMPSDYSAHVVADGEEVILKVNHPHRVRFGEDLYLAGYDVAAGSDSEYCILQVVRDPWKHGVVTGVLLMLAGALLLFAGGPDRRSGKTADVES